MIDAVVARLVEPRRLVFERETIDPSAVREDEVIGETLISAISPGTEVAAYSGAPPLRPGVVYPRLVGYCNVARVVAKGARVEHLEIGDRILTYSSHRSHFKISHADIVAKLRPGIRSEDAAVAYLFQLGYNAVLRGEVRVGNTVVVIGLGALGIASVALAGLAGARVIALSDHEALREKARALGATCFARAELDALLAAIGPRLAHAVISTSNRWDDWRVALQCAGNQGTIAVLGFPGRSEAPPSFNPLDSAHFYMRQLRIVASGQSPEGPDPQGFLPFNVRENVQRILEWIEAGTLRTDVIVSGEFAANRLDEAYQALVQRVQSPITYLLRWTDTA